MKKQKGAVGTNNSTSIHKQPTQQPAPEQPIQHPVQNTGDDELRERVAQLENSVKQALADYQNLKRDMEKRLQVEGNLVRADVLASVIGIADDIDLALAHQNGQDDASWRSGIELILKKMQTTIEQSGAQRIECKAGDVFDPRLHEAVGVVHEGKDGTIAQVVQNGYVIGETMVRPARVIVSKANISKQ